MTANTEQVGGVHYKVMAMQPIELIAKLSFDFIQGSIVKYLSRCKEDRLEDLKKAKHFCQLGLSYGNWEKVVNISSSNCKTLYKNISEYVDDNGLHSTTSDILLYVAHNDYKKATILINNLIEELENKQ